MLEKIHKRMEFMADIKKHTNNKIETDEKIIFLPRNKQIALLDLGICEHCTLCLFLEGISFEQREKIVWICPRCKKVLSRKSLLNHRAALLAVTAFRLGKGGFLYEPEKQSENWLKIIPTFFLNFLGITPTTPKVYHWKPGAIMIYNNMIVSQ